MSFGMSTTTLLLKYSSNAGVPAWVHYGSSTVSYYSKRGFPHYPIFSGMTRVCSTANTLLDDAFVVEKSPFEVFYLQCVTKILQIQ